MADTTNLHSCKPNRSHPLMGADPVTLARMIRRNRPVSRAAWPLLLAAFGSGIGRLPFTLIERAWVALRRPRDRMPPPVFIVGHWRSGTTHLYNLMSRSPQFGFVTPVATGLPWDFLLLGRLLRPLLERALPKERFIDRIPVKPDSPQEDEIALASMQAISFYHGLYFPARLREHFLKGVFFDGVAAGEVRSWQQRFRQFMEKLAIDQPGRQLLIKNPVYTARIGMLHGIWPEARFIHIRRNPYVVFQSTRNFYRKLLAEFALQPFDPDWADELILDSYPRLMRMLDEDAARLPPNRFVEVKFETFEQAPLEQVERIYRTLDLDGFEQARPVMQEYLDGVRDYRKNVYRFPAADNARVAKRWAPFIERWDYQPPGG